MQTHQPTSDAANLEVIWVQHIDGAMTQNVARDSQEKSLIERIHALSAPGTTMLWKAFYSSPEQAMAASAQDAGADEPLLAATKPGQERNSSVGAAGEAHNGDIKAQEGEIAQGLPGRVKSITPGMAIVEVQLDGDVPEWADPGQPIHLLSRAAFTALSRLGRSEAVAQQAIGHVPEPVLFARACDLDDLVNIGDIGVLCFGKEGHSGAAGPWSVPLYRNRPAPTFDELAVFIAGQRKESNIPDYIDDATIMKGVVTQHEWNGWKKRSALASQ